MGVAFEPLLRTYGYWATAVGTFFEGETILILSGFLAHQGYLKLSWVIVAAAIGAFVGDVASYWLGRWKVDWILQKVVTIKLYYPHAQRFIERYGVISIFVGRFLYGLRVATGVVCGMTGLPWSKFAPAAFFACSFWAIVVGSAGYYFGKTMDLLLGKFRYYEKYGVLFILVVGLIVWLAKYVLCKNRNSTC